MNKFVSEIVHPDVDKNVSSEISGEECMKEGMSGGMIGVDSGKRCSSWLKCGETWGEKKGRRRLCFLPRSSRLGSRARKHGMAVGSGKDSAFRLADKNGEQKDKG